MLARRLARFALAPLLAAAFAPGAAPAASAAELPPPPDFHDCPGGFLVYQPLPVGPLKLPAASYNITVINMSCDYASRALESFIGHEELPAPWTANVPSKTFSNNTGSFSLSASRAGTGDPPGCPPFTIAPRDRVGTVPLPRGRYALRPGGADPLSCLAGAKVLIRALDAPPGASSGWQPTALPGSRVGLTLRNDGGQTVTIRRLDDRTAGGGYSSPG